MQGSDEAELSTLTTSVAEITERVATMAERLQASDDGADVAAALFEVERSLRMASRNLDRAIRVAR